MRIDRRRTARPSRPRIWTTDERRRLGGLQSELAETGIVAVVEREGGATIMTLDWYWLIIAGLSTFRLALLFSRELGPMRIFQKLRNLPPPKSSAREGLSCPFCIGMTFSAIVTTFLWWRDRFPGIDWPIYWLAISAIAVILHLAFAKDF